MREVIVGAGALLTWLVPARAAPVVVIEGWTRHAVGTYGIPLGWTGESFGRRAAYDFAIEAEGDRRVLHLKSRDEHSTITKDMTGAVVLRDTPILEWTWNATVLPADGDVRRAETTDFAAQLDVIWPRFPALLRSRIIEYVWDSAGTIARSQKTGRVTFIENPAAIAISFDSNDNALDG
jgi:Protein of unknown function (DUF3047)